MPGVRRVIRRIGGGIGQALRARWGVFAAVGAAVLVLDILVPVLVLSIARTPVDYFMVNPWLSNLPGYVASGKGPLTERLGRAWELALFWFSANGAFGIDWGFAVSAADLARFALTAALIGAYFALWVHRRGRGGLPGWRPTVGQQGGILGAVGSVFGVATGGCSVMGCGAPVIPVVGLAFVGLSSGTLAWLSQLSTVATALVIGGMALGVVYLAWRVGDAPPHPALSPSGGEGTRAPSPLWGRG
ncbi:MAG TPA: hypothetical protein VFS98_15020, partial [Methylomirabilota bacterium]|nr:hypothetical protein [Methylomirabilota bacterium]